MKKILLLMTLIALFSSCSKNDEDLKKITNLTGQTWYETTVYVYVFTPPFGPFNKGEVKVGESITVSTVADSFYISFTNSSGFIVESKKLYFIDGSATVRAIDL